MKQSKIHYKWLYYGTVFAVAFLSFFYNDLKSLTIWSTNIWDTLAYTGDIRNFYWYSSQNIYGLEHAFVGGDILIYLPWAIWNLPIWAIQYFTKIDIVHNPVLLLYSKSFLLFLLFGVCVLIKKIIILLDRKEQSEVGIFIFLSSPFVLYGIAYAGQNDILVILMFLYSICGMMQGQGHKFLIGAAICIAFKPFFLFSYVAVILLTEKKLWKIGRNVLICLSAFVGQKLFFYNAPMYRESIEYGPSKEIISKMLNVTLSIPPFAFSMFIGALIFTYFVAYCTESKPEKIVYYSLVPMICYFVFVPDNFYRPLYMFVIWSIMVVIREEYLRVNIILEMLYTSCFSLIAILNTPFFLWPRYSVWADDYNNMIAICYRVDEVILRDWSDVLTICSTVCTCVLFLFIIINNVAFKKKNEILSMKTEGYLYTIRGILYLVPLLISFVCARI